MNVTTASQRVSVYLVLMVVCLFAVFPIFWMCSMAIKPASESFGTLGTMLPKVPTFENFKRVSELVPIWRNFLNSVIVSFVGTITTLFFCSLAGFAFAKYDFPGKEGLFILMIATMMIPPETNIVPVFLIMRKLGWINNLLSLIVPKIATAVGIFYMRQYISGFPTSVMEQARIDGCSEFKIYWNVVIPVITPALAAWSSIVMIARWNELLWPLLFMRTQEMFTLMVAISTLPVLEGLSTPWPVIMAGTTIGALPLITMYFILQKFQMTGLMAGATKG
ncbi:sugar ABC transporter permease [candidate division KSB3 bacterium]|uniref:Sugar ABC transporter permease n=1 Tax=candidate division KSB3 bacterium TaxID=2044937 RepID=A0A2G6E3T7_9BACT|nr:MAG: sugar ABC transporter permease [candidate division KSB3 bacterium]PIE29390.1 MAG: sugar ABC transporter permease [candidate division KSB3 bacterium]